LLIRHFEAGREQISISRIPRHDMRPRTVPIHFLAPFLPGPHVEVVEASLLEAAMAHDRGFLPQTRLACWRTARRLRRGTARERAVSALASRPTEFFRSEDGWNYRRPDRNDGVSHRAACEKARRWPIVSCFLPESQIIRFAFSVMASTNFVYIFFSTRMRLPAEQTSPWLMKIPNSAPSTAASQSASSKNIFGDLPPSSRVTRLRVLAALAAMSFPTVALPVKAILSTFGCATSEAPAV